MPAIAENIGCVRERIGRAARRAGRAAEQIRLVAVSKTVEPERVLEAVAAGIQILGENYVQEAQKKMAAVGHGVSWHFIGHLQSNKAKPAVRLFDCIHTVDRLSLAEELNRIAKQQGKIVPILLEVHLSEEITKFGAAEPEIWPLAEKISAMDGLALKGLMTMPPYFDDPEESRPYFIRLRKLAEELARKNPGISGGELSMGMSNDFEVAVEEGATLVRVGTAIFGPRPAK
jgi:PLP dependent protein